MTLAVSACVACASLVTLAFAQPAQPAQPAEPAEPQEADGPRLLEEDEINRIRQAELQPADARQGGGARAVRVRFENRAVQRFVETRGDLDFRTFNQAGDVEQAIFILANSRDEELRNDVRIATDPAAVGIFKQNLYPAILQGCATSQCHGSNDPARHGGFRLVAEGRGDPQVYTNFHTIMRTTVEVPNPAGGAFGGPETVQRLLVDRQDPESSLLLGYVLPAGQVEFPHPTVNDATIRPIFQRPTDAGFRQLFAWIGEVLPKDVGDYGIDAEEADEVDAEG